MHVIDGLLHHESELSIEEHYTDTAGYNDQVFGLSHLLGFRFAPPEALVEWATGGVRYPPEPGVRRVLLIPHTVYRPWTIQADAEQTKILYYPVSDESLYGDSDPYRPPHMLVQMLKALADEHRLRIVKLLAEQECSLQELTDKLSLAKSTVHHHLSMLRSAQLVGTSGDKYALKPAALDRLPLLWQQYAAVTDIGFDSETGHA